LINTRHHYVAAKVARSASETYGRLLVELYDDEKLEKSYNNLLVEKEVAVSYDGGKKVAPWII
jgi:hypothetical protein